MTPTIRRTYVESESDGCACVCVCLQEKKCPEIHNNGKSFVPF